MCNGWMEGPVERVKLPVQSRGLGRLKKCPHLQMDPGQDLLLAALSESGICPNDLGLLDVDPQDGTQPSTAQQVSSL